MGTHHRLHYIEHLQAPTQEGVASDDDLEAPDASLGVNFLVASFQKRKWNPADDEEALRKAEEVGTLKKLLGLFQFPLDRFPDVADRTVQAAADWIKQKKDKHREEREDMVEWCEQLGETHPTPEASMLANFLLVPGTAAPDLMEAIVEDMVVFLGSNDVPEPVKADRSFPEELGVVYLGREVTKEDTKDDQVVFDEKLRLLSFSGRDFDDVDEIQKLDLDKDPLQTVRTTYAKHGYFLTSAYHHSVDSGTPMAPGTPCSSHTRVGADGRVPEGAQKVVFVLPSALPGEKLARGGFLYLDVNKEIVGLNALSESRRCRALSFEPQRKLSELRITEQEMQKLEARAYEIPSSEADLRAKGAKSCAWIFPDEFSDIELQNGHGAFVYLFNDSKQNCYYESRGSAQVMNRGSLQWMFGRTEMNLEMLDTDTRGAAIEEKIGRAKWDAIKCCKRRSCGSSSTKNTCTTAPIKVARISVPGVVHPAILRGLAFAPQDSVLDTRAAEAIASAAFESVSWYVFSSILSQVILLLSLLWFARNVRADAAAGSINSFVSEMKSSIECGAFLAISIVLVKDLIVNLMLFQLYWSQRWMRQFWTFRRILQAVVMVLEILLLWTMWPQDGHGEGVCGIQYHRPADPAFITDLFGDANAHSHCPKTRLLLALIGGSVWIKLLTLLSSLEILNLGHRILPISKTLEEMTSFLFVMLFFFGAAFTVSYTMTDDFMSCLWISTFRLAFAGDYSTRMFFRANGTEDANDGIVEDDGIEWVVRFAMFVFFGILIMAALNNIFIGIMGNTYDYYQDRAAPLFVRQRALVSLDYLLLRRYQCWGEQENKDKHLWICTSATSRDDDNCLHGDQSLRGNMKDYVQEEVSRVEEKVDRVLDCLGKFQLEMQLQGAKPLGRRSKTSVGF